MTARDDGIAVGKRREERQSVNVMVRYISSGSWEASQVSSGTRLRLVGGLRAAWRASQPS